MFLLLPPLAQLFNWLSHVFEPSAPEEESLGIHRLLPSVQEDRQSTETHVHRPQVARGLRTHVSWYQEGNHTALATEIIGTWEGKNGGLALIRDFPINTAMPRNQHPQMSPVGFFTILRKFCLHPSLEEDVVPVSEISTNTHAPIPGYNLA